MALRICGCVVITLFASLCTGDGNLSFASYYGDHMVLQKSPERAVLWGYGPDGAQVTISLSGPIEQKTPPVKVTEGIWRVTLDPVEAGGPYNVTAALEHSTLTLIDVLFGDVWLCGGQSNMRFTTSQVFNASEELALAAKYPKVRFFTAALTLSETELTDLVQVELPWSVPTANLTNVSAVCWFFGRYMYENLKYPIGLVESCWGGTPVETWSSSRALEQCGLYSPEEGNSGWLHWLYTSFKGVCVSLNICSGDAPGPKKNSVLWNAMIHPLLNMTLKGVIWYQGESNADYHQEKYSCSFPAMIDDWRMAFHQGSGGQTASDFPFGFVQLSTYRKGSTDESFPNIRWHQTADTGFVPNPRMNRTFMAVAMDLPDETSPYGTIHPRDKKDVAYRLSLGARAVAYGEDVHFVGPFPNQVVATQMHLNITYDQTVSVTNSTDIFEICCSGGMAHCGPESIWIQAPIEQWGPTTVRVSTSRCPSTDNITGLRYAWKNWPCDFKACPVYSASGALPAPPFKINRCFTCTSF